MDWIRSIDLLPQVLRRRATETPDEVYLRHVDGDCVTYRQTFEATLMWAAALRRLGVSRGENVLSLLPNSFDAYHLWLGQSWIGSVDVSLNTAYQGRMLHYTIEFAEARVLIVPERLLPKVAEIAGDLTVLETVVVPDATGELPDLPQRVITGAEFFEGVEPDPSTADEPQPWDVCCIIWTSGTTGPSKGVMIPWGEMHRLCGVIAEVTTSDDVMYQFLPPFHFGGKLSYCAAVLQGSSLVMREVFSSTNFWGDTREHAITHVNMMGPMMRMLMNAPPQPDDADNPLRTMGSAPLPAGVEDFQKRFGISGVNTYYGTTEIGVPFGSPGFDLANTASCGRPRDGYDVRLVDEHDYPVPEGEVGELIVRAHHPWTMNMGYYKMPQETAEAWRNGWFHTKDAFRTDQDGNFYFVDRIKDALRRRGENISSFEVEAYVTEHPEITECAAVAAESDLGEDDVKIFAVRAEGSALTAQALSDWLTPRMPRFMLPRYIEFIDGLPKTEATQRVKKAELRARGNGADTWDREAAVTR